MDIMASTGQIFGNVFCWLVPVVLYNIWTVISFTKANPTIYPIGGVLSTNENAVQFDQEITNLKSNLNLLPPGVTLDSPTVLMNPNPIRTALSVCDHLINAQVYAVVVSHPLKGDLSPAAVSYTCGFYHIPVIGISSRDSAFSDKVRIQIFCNFLKKSSPSRRPCFFFVFCQTTTAAIIIGLACSWVW